MRQTSGRSAFTLIELLVVVAVIAILVGVLLPAIGKARKAAQAIQASNNARTVAQGVANYTVSYRFLYPPSYVYPISRTSSKWKLEDQKNQHPNPGYGYVHWSYFLFDGDESVKEEAFTDPVVEDGGAPATNPGPDPADWEPEQANGVGQQSPSEFPKDRQAKRMAFCGNAALFPRNKFNVPWPRKNRLVKSTEIEAPGKTILVGQYLNFPNWASIRLSSDDRIVSHRPISPFVGASSGRDVYQEPATRSSPRFFYPREDVILTQDFIGPHMIESNLSELNAVARHHDGGNDARYGGTGIYAFCDGHVEKLQVWETVRRRLWGRRYYSLTGGTVVDLEQNAFDGR